MPEWIRTANPKDWAILVGVVVLGFVLAAVLPAWAWQTFTAVMIVAFIVLSVRRGSARRL
jgi:hypothetical protein